MNTTEMMKWYYEKVHEGLTGKEIETELDKVIQTECNHRWKIGIDECTKCGININKI